MVTERWKELIGNTVRQVRDGQIPMARIDDAVSRILRETTLTPASHLTCVDASRAEIETRS